MNNDTPYHATVGIDIAKNVFQIFKLTEEGEVSNRAVKRSDFLKQFHNCPRCLIGMKVHVGVDKISGVDHTRTTTAANVHDIVETEKLRRDSDNEIIGDSGYVGMEKRDDADPVYTTYAAAKRYGQRKKLSLRGQKQEHSLSSATRSKVEHVFHRIKVQFATVRLVIKAYTKIPAV